MKKFYSGFIFIRNSFLIISFSKSLQQFIFEFYELSVKMTLEGCLKVFLVKKFKENFSL